MFSLLQYCTYDVMKKLFPFIYLIKTLTLMLVLGLMSLRNRERQLVVVVTSESNRP